MCWFIGKMILIRACKTKFEHAFGFPLSENWKLWMCSVKAEIKNPKPQNQDTPQNQPIHFIADLISMSDLNKWITVM